MTERHYSKCMSVCKMGVEFKDGKCVFVRRLIIHQYGYSKMNTQQLLFFETCNLSCF